MDLINKPSDYDIKEVLATVWDMDGTVLDSQRHNYDWLKWVYEKYSESDDPFPEYTPDFMKSYNGVYREGGLEGIYTKIIKTDWHKHEKGIWTDYISYNRENLIDVIRGEKVNMAEVVSEIHERGKITPRRSVRHRQAINTTKDFASIEKSLEEAGILSYFDCKSTYDDIKIHLTDGILKGEGIQNADLKTIREHLPKEATKYLEKPNSLSSMIILDRLGVQHNEAIIFEDTPTGIQSYKPVISPRRSKPAYVVGVTWGFEPDAQRLIDSGADAIMNDPSEIIPFYESLGVFN